jgi:N-acetylmuramic acid 6-phosphate etherase
MATLTMPDLTAHQKAGTNHVSEPVLMTTETSNAASEGFDTKSALEIARIINQEDAKVAAAIKKSLPAHPRPKQANPRPMEPVRQ